ncbi:Uma2 family endonuclease [Frankia nepalensis]|uniref:Uma2 family endonuclease n=2 Tax=Frankia nepalensis TaxID=1836974 RepID=A0A937RI83_9ACTN|nr:Uma2 family endonuclease [Frankia nepalensis]MBL7512402.1 Uma2 family endonuclease [Frankia nepalensis]MBL7632718.1 Uma2 family endonuclease [Frankia nepalensis]
MLGTGQTHGGLAWVDGAMRQSPAAHAGSAARSLTARGRPPGDRGGLPRLRQRREDRGRKITEHALAGIPQYWIINFDPEPRIQILRLTDDLGRYGTPQVFSGDDTVKIENPFPASFPSSDLQDFT